MTQLYTMHQLEILTMDQLRALHKHYSSLIYTTPRHSTERLISLASLHNIEDAIARKFQEKYSTHSPAPRF